MPSFMRRRRLAEALGELMTSAPQAGLQRVFRYAEFLGASPVE